MTSLPVSNPSAPADVLDQEARVWVRRLASGEATQWDIQAFKRWQQQSAAHAAAFEQARRQWHQLRQGLGALLRGSPEVAAQHERAMARHARPPQAGRRAFLGAALGGTAVAAATAAAVVHPPLGLWPAPQEWGADVRTATGERRSLALDGEVMLTLNTQTSIRHQSAGAAGEGIDLLRGEAAIDQSSTGAAFNVLAGAGRVRAQAARFEVRHLQDEAVRVTCLEGRLQIEHPAGQRALQAREQLVYDAQGLGRVRDIDPRAVSAWRAGELWFDRTPLHQAIAEINRYRPGRVLLMARGQQDSAVSGRFSIAALDAALLQIQHSFDLGARALPGGVLVLS
ncbi:FecR domain-containing protein [Xenophilus arseniciresistens]|uniref:FecR domain-containing protein n=1 Tax=Xenophilus arseniciresistens TaxID=1283306 RepID=A0AAE3N6T6_9BURK|nr:FecR domain-containing protein [Xenophilus arseniciresistens]MDA7415002.1 FecR domain-containing protein [Xenophilus arseniciresistens]